MKELSIEAKAKAYDELFVKAKQIYNKENDVLILHTIEDFFPELKESEDERIRKELIKLLRNLFNNYTYFIKDPFYTECIAWLEKQGKQKQEWGEEDESRITTICTYLQDYARLSGSESRTIRINEYCDWLKSLKDRYTWKPSNEQMLAINIAINVLGKGTLNGKQLIELQEQLKRLKEE